MNAIYSVTVTPTKDLDVSRIIKTQECNSATECKNRMRQLILAKHPSYWKRVHRLTAQYQEQTLTIDPQEVVGTGVLMR